MKNTFIIMMACMLMSILQAQEIVEKSTSISSSTTVNLDFDFADQIIIKSWDKKEAYVKAIVNINDNTDNDKFSLDATSDKNGISFKSDIEDLEEISKRNHHHQQGVVIRDDDHCIHMEIDFEVYLPEMAKIELNTISGNIEIIGFSETMDIKTISGFIDLSVSSKRKLNFELETITGGFYSNLDLDILKESDWKHHFVGGDVEAVLNGGGNEIKLETISGDIYLREEK